MASADQERAGDETAQQPRPAPPLPREHEPHDTSGPRSGHREPAMFARWALARGWCGSWPRAGLILIAICLCVLLPGLFSLPPIDRDESRFAQASRQMMESGDYIVPRLQDRPRLNKPPLVYWLQCASVKAFTGNDVSKDAIWMYRIPGALCMIASVLLTWRLGCLLFDERAGWLGAAMLAVCPLVVVEAHQARADQLLLATTLASMACLWRIVRSDRKGWGWPIALWLCVGAGILAKGPVTPLVVVLTACFTCVLRRDWSPFRRTRPVLGLIIVSGIVAPWLIAVSRTVGWETYWKTVWTETVGRGVSAPEGHFGPPGYHLLLLVVLFFPGSILTGLAFVTTWQRGVGCDCPWWFPRWVGRTSDLFLLAWIIPTWIVFEIILTKLPHYVMPVYPAVALLTARAVLSAAPQVVNATSSRWARAGYVAWGTVGVVILAGLPWAATHLLKSAAPRSWMIPWGYTLGAIGAIVAFIATRAAFQRRPLRALALTGSASVAMFVAMFQFLLPANPDLWLSPRIVALFTRATGQAQIPCAAVGYQEDSLIFLTRGRIERIAPEQAAEWMRRNPGGMMVAREQDKLDPVSLNSSTSLTGFNYARSRREHVRVGFPYLGRSRLEEIREHENDPRNGTRGRIDDGS